MSTIELLKFLNNLHAFNTDRQFLYSWHATQLNFPCHQLNTCCSFSPKFWTEVNKKCYVTYWFSVLNIWSKKLTNYFFREYNILISGIPHVNVDQICYNGSKIMQTKLLNAYPWIFVRISNIYLVFLLRFIAKSQRL